MVGVVITVFFLKLLDDQFSATSLAQALGISQTQSLLWSHVYKKFMELVGPVAAQRKLDAMRSKSYVHLDPLLKAKVRPCGQHLFSIKDVSMFWFCRSAAIPC